MDGSRGEDSDYSDPDVEMSDQEKSPVLSKSAKKRNKKKNKEEKKKEKQEEPK